MADRQWGLVTRAQLEASGLEQAGISRWTRDGRLRRVHPGVYAVGHLALGVEARLAAGLLYAGPGAGLWGATGASWVGIVTALPKEVHVCTPHRRKSLPNVVVHDRKRFDRIWHNDLPVTPVAQLLLDMATQVRFMDLRRGLADAVYRKLVTLDEVEAQLRRGKPGSAALRTALECHRPELARTRSLLEDKFVLLRERYSITPPGGVNVEIEGWVVDFVWFDARVVVELDGHAGHANPAAVERDRRRDLALRAAGFLVLRYTWQQITHTPELVAADLRNALAARTPTS